MKVLFDQGTPAPLRHHLIGHEVVTSFEMGWSGLGNGGLLGAAIDAKFEVFITTDQNLRHQQNLKERRFGVVVLTTTSWPRIERNLALVLAALAKAQPATVLEVAIPD